MQYYLVEVATGETALPDLDYLIQYNNYYHAAVMLGLGLILGVVIIGFFFPRR